jgi:hypothetical protein
MRLALLSTCLLAAACNSTSEERGTAPKEEQQTPAMALTALEVEAKTLLDRHDRKREEVEGFERRVKGAMEPVLFDPASGMYRELRSGKSGAICGQVNAKNRYGAYVGFKDFVLSRDGETIYISRYADGINSEQYTSFAEAYVTACASKAEKDRYAALTEPVDWGYSNDYDADAAVDAAADAAAAADDAAESVDEYGD